MVGGAGGGGGGGLGGGTSLLNPTSYSSYPTPSSLSFSQSAYPPPNSEGGKIYVPLLYNGGAGSSHYMGYSGFIPPNAPSMPPSSYQQAVFLAPSSNYELVINMHRGGVNGEKRIYKGRLL